MKIERKKDQKKKKCQNFPINSSKSITMGFILVLYHVHQELLFLMIMENYLPTMFWQLIINTGKYLTMWLYNPYWIKIIIPCKHDNVSYI